MRWGGMPRATMADLMISHSESWEPGVTPPLTIDQRNKPSRHSLTTSSTRRATNTGENVICSLPVIEAAFGLSNIHSVICLGNTWTGRRYPMTLHRHWPEVEKMLITVDSFDTPWALWHSDPVFRTRVFSEWDKIEPYKANGFIAEWPVM